MKPRNLNFGVSPWSQAAQRPCRRIYQACCLVICHEQHCALTVSKPPGPPEAFWLLWPCQACAASLTLYEPGWEAWGVDHAEHQRDFQSIPIWHSCHASTFRPRGQHTASIKQSSAEETLCTCFSCAVFMTRCFRCCWWSGAPQQPTIVSRLCPDEDSAVCWRTSHQSDYASMWVRPVKLPWCVGPLQNRKRQGSGTAVSMHPSLGPLLDQVRSLQRYLVLGSAACRES